MLQKLKENVGKVKNIMCEQNGHTDKRERKPKRKPKNSGA